MSALHERGRERSTGKWTDTASLFSVSTVKDSLENVAAFVDANLAAGIDHMFVFLDSSQPDVAAYLRGRSETTVVQTDDIYWNGRTPQNLNVRQIVNANVANTALAPFPWAQWLIHLDCDEVFHTSRTRLLELDAGARCVRLRPLEAVARWHWEGEVTLFKRLLGKPNLERLVERGVIDVAKNRAYYRGHVVGKPGIRPAFDLDLRIHDAWTADGGPVETIEGRWLRLLHYETPSGEDFMRKWVASHAPVPRGRVRERRRAQTAAVEDLLHAADLGETRRQKLAREVYALWFEDDVSALQELDLLVEHHRADDDHVPVPLAARPRRELERWLAELTPLDKSYFRPTHTKFDKLSLVRSLSGALAPSEPGLAGQLETAVARASAVDVPHDDGAAT